MHSSFLANRRRILSLGALSALGVGSGAAHAQKKYGPGVSDTTIRIGQTAPYSGPAAAFGAMARVMTAYMKKVNDEGGINGRKIDMISLDDAFSPPRTVEQVRKLVEAEPVLFINTIGTTTTAAVHRYLHTKKVPLLFISSGAAKWGNPADFPYAMGFNATYELEGQTFANHVLTQHADKKIAILYQNDDFGRELLHGFKAGLGDKAKSLVIAERSYELTDSNVDSQLVTLKGSGAEVFFNISTPKFAAQSIRKIAELGWKPEHMISYVSASVGSVLRPAGFDNAKGLVSSAYMKDPTDERWANDPGLNEWRAFMAKYVPGGSTSDWSNVNAYATAELMVQVLKQCGDDLTRENVMRQATNLQGVVLTGLLPGVTINTSPKNYFPIQEMQLQRFDGSKWVLFGNVVSSRK